MKSLYFPDVEKQKGIDRALDNRRRQAKVIGNVGKIRDNLWRID